MTPREPDRFDAQAREWMDSECPHERDDYDEIPCVLCLAGFLRQGAEARDLFAARLATHLVHARARISELEAALREAQGHLCAEHCEWTGSGEHDDQCVKLSKVLAAPEPAR